MSHLPKTIVVATDFSEYADHALDYAIALADKLSAKLYLLHAIAIPELGVAELGVAVTSTAMESLVKSSQTTLDKLATRGGATKIDTLLRSGDARDVIVAENVVRHAPCPVLTVRLPAT